LPRPGANPRKIESAARPNGAGLRGSKTEMDSFVGFIPALGALGLVFAAALYWSVLRRGAGTEEMQEIATAIHDGAMAFLRREYTILAGFVVVVAVLLYNFLGSGTAIAFVSGAGCSVLAGFSGMKAATRANVRTTAAAKDQGQGQALLTAFNGGAVMGVAVASLGLIGVGLLFRFYGNVEHASVINGFAMGASSIALFARVGGGIYTKAADVGADLVGKVEAGIPEDDPRNPGVIADNVGDNVGDVAGMGADIFESYVGSVIATIAIAATLLPEGLAGLQAAGATDTEGLRGMLMALPLVLAAEGLVASFLGILSMRILKAVSPAAALRYSTFIAAGLFMVGAYATINAHPIANQVFWAVALGVVVGIVIGLITEYYTAAARRRTSSPAWRSDSNRPPCRSSASVPGSGSATRWRGFTVSDSQRSACWRRSASRCRSMPTDRSPTTPAASVRWPAWGPTFARSPTASTRWETPLRRSARALPSARRP